jgi:predicted dienelactone hydrolase
MTRREFTDPARRNWSGTEARPITTLVWYPAVGVTPAETLTIGPRGAPLFVGGVVAGSASVAEGRWPVVLLSHGTGGSALQLAWLGTALARAGFVAIGVNHHGNSGAEPPLDPRGFFLWWERTIDLRVALDYVVRDSLLGPHVDTTRVAAAGFSLGGYTALSLAGARTDRKLFEEFCASPARDFTCEPQPEFPEAPARFADLAERDSLTRQSLRRAAESHADSRVSSVAVLSPAVVRALTATSLRQLGKPLLIIGAESDHIAPIATNARYVASLTPASRLVLLPGADHYVFLNECTEHGRQLLPDVCVDGAGVDRAEIHRRAAQLIINFLRARVGSH